VRELENVVQQMIVFCKNKTITMADIPPHILMNDARIKEMNAENLTLPMVIEEMEKEYIMQALEKTSWHRENTARLLGITRKMLGDRMSKYGLRKESKNEPH